MVHQIALKAAKSSSHNAIFRDQKSIRGKPQISSVARPFGISNDRRRTFRAPNQLCNAGKNNLSPSTRFRRLRATVRGASDDSTGPALMEMQNIFNAQNQALTLSGLNEQTRQLQSMQGLAAGNQGCVRPLSFPLGVTDTGAWLFRVVSPHRDARHAFTTSCSDHPSR
tara:strand:+ start:220 stop:723 length:504 start_codon:yes stop_codon:yes gene_type:complete